MEKTLRAAMNPQGWSVALKEVVFTVEGIESSVYIVIERNPKNVIHGFHQYDTHVKADRKFERCSHKK